VTDSQPDQRETLLQEYLKLTDIVHAYDDYFLRIKTWGVTVSAAALGLGIQMFSPGVLAVALVLAMSFWVTETHFKMLQLGHMRRVSELERSLSSAKSHEESPRIFGALAEERRTNIASKRVRRVIWWPQVMFPHVGFVAGATLGLLVVFGRAIWAATT